MPVEPLLQFFLLCLTSGGVHTCCGDQVVPEGGRLNMTWASHSLSWYAWPCGLGMWWCWTSDVLIKELVLALSFFQLGRGGVPQVGIISEQNFYIAVPLILPAVALTSLEIRVLASPDFCFFSSPLFSFPASSDHLCVLYYYREKNNILIPYVLYWDVMANRKKIKCIEILLPPSVFYSCVCVCYSSWRYYELKPSTSQGVVWPIK